MRTHDLGLVFWNRPLPAAFGRAELLDQVRDAAGPGRRPELDLVQLRETAALTQRPLEARLAQELVEAVTDNKTWGGREQELGPEALAVQALCRAADYHHSSSNLADLDIPEALQLLREGPLPPAALDAVVRLALDLKDRALAGTCLEALQTWATAGRFQVVRDGEAVSFRPDLILDSPHVVGTRLVLPPSNPTPEQKLAREILEGIPNRDYVYARPLPEAPGLDRLEGLDPATARKVVASILGDSGYLTDGKTHQKIVQLLARPALKELLRPHLAELAGYTERAEEHGQVHRGYASDEWQAAHYDFLLGAFPEALDEGLVRRQLVPLLVAQKLPRSQDIAALTQRLWKDRPDLVAPTLDQLGLTSPREGLGESVLGLLKVAAEEHGWKPDARGLEWLVSRVYQPQGRHESFFNWKGPRAAEFPAVLDLLSGLEARHPGLLNELKLPDRRGELVDVKTYALYRLLDDPDFVAPEKVAVRLFEGTDPIVQAVYRFIRPEDHVEGVLAMVKRGLDNPRSQLSVDDRVVTGLGFLARLAVSDEKLADRMLEALQGQPSVYFMGLSPVLGPVRFAGAVRDFEAGAGEEPPELVASRLYASEHADPYEDRIGAAWERRQRSYHPGRWPERAPDLGLPPRLAVEALEHLRSEYPDEQQEAAFSQLEGVLQYLGPQGDPAERLRTALEMLETRQAYLTPAGSGVEQRGNQVRVGGVVVRTRRR
ncbi:MAG: hypothetical protein AB1758_07985 [Candidatus Eremiobacterota bacterium]